MTTVSATERKEINAFLPRYSGIWKSGLEGLERDYDVTISGSAGEYQLSLTRKNATGWNARIEINIKKDLLAMYFSIPDGPACDPSEKRRVDETLKKLGQLWIFSSIMIFPVKTGSGSYGSPSTPITVDLSRGIKSLTDHFDIVWKKGKRHPILYLSPLNPSGWESLAIVVDTGKGRIVEILQKDMLDDPVKFLSPEEKQEIETALKKHGNFQNYGRVDDDLESLRKVFDIQLTMEPSKIHLSLGPKSQAGHAFFFTIDRKTGEIKDVAVGEVEPPPSSRDHKGESD